MSPNTNLLEIIDVASPCPASWEAMEGGDVVRFCSQCRLNVYNLSAMPADSAEAFLRERAGEERLCVRFYRRHDGTVITSDCPVGLAAVRAKVKRAVLGALTVAASLVATVFSGCSQSTNTHFKNSVTELKRLLKVEREVLQGDVAPPRPVQGTAAPPQVTPPPVLFQGGACPPKVEHKSNLIMGKFLPPKSAKIPSTSEVQP